MFTRLIKVMSNPALVVRGVLRLVPGLPLEMRVSMDLFPRPNYAYGIYKGARLAQALKIPAISVIEFGVAGGRGLVAMEQLAATIGQATGVKIQVFGFDLGAGLPASEGYRDLPWLWKSGYYRMDVEKLRARLKGAELILGNVKQAVPKFCQRTDWPPLAFAAFDLDFHSSTKYALGILDLDPARYLPRTLCYFDDLIGGDAAYRCPYAGELLAIREFNESHQEAKLCEINAFWHKRHFPAVWNLETYVCHFFQHPQYSTHVGQMDGSLPL